MCLQRIPNTKRTHSIENKVYREHILQREREKRHVPLAHPQCILQRTNSIENTFYRQHILQTTHTISLQRTHSREHILQRTHSIENKFYRKTHSIEKRHGPLAHPQHQENTFYREHILQRTHSIENTFYREQAWAIGASPTPKAPKTLNPQL